MTGYPLRLMPDDERHVTAEELQRQRVALDQLLTDAEHLREEITGRLDRLHRDQRQDRAGQPKPQTPRRPAPKSR